MKTRKQLPCYGVLSHIKIDMPKLYQHLQNTGLLDFGSYNDIQYSKAEQFQGYIAAGNTVLNSYFKEDDADNLESKRFRQVQLTKFDPSKSNGPVEIKETTFFERVKRLRQGDSRYVPEADELNYGIKTELLTGELDKVYNLFDSRVTRARLAWMGPGHSIKPHFDYDTTLICRYHIPIITNPGVLFYMQKSSKIYELYMPADGKVYFFNTGLKHWVHNKSQFDRLHLIFDVHGQKELEHLEEIVGTEVTEEQSN